MQPLADELRARGWPPRHVVTVSFADPFGSSRANAGQIADALGALEAHTGSQQITVVAYSMGGLALRWFLAHNDTHAVRTAIFIATPHRGTWMAWLAPGTGAAEMRPSSQFLRELNAAPYPRDVRCISFRAPYDTRLVPPATAWLEHSEHRMLPAAGHKRILRHRAVIDTIIAAIEEP